MTIDSRAALPPGPTYDYGGHSVQITPEPGSGTRWRVAEDDGYLGMIATADPVKGEPEVHFAVHFAGEEDIPPIKIVPLWTTAVEFLIDAGEPQSPPES
ncbi:hypothetical protein ACFQ9V_06545 [Leifsonia sp. NPDC056665]|uniref:hypothetical protein n=1 Tax=Leifsonia sp. NPDC056665 TaxID=3345901 RepID=UPI0036A73F1C